jgi:predicted RNase H-like nuclease (RuvC/YqgF family)
MRTTRTVALSPDFAGVDDSGIIGVWKARAKKNEQEINNLARENDKLRQKNITMFQEIQELRAKFDNENASAQTELCTEEYSKKKKKKKKSLKDPDTIEASNVH